MQAGRLDQRITFLTPVSTQNDSGHPTTKWFIFDEVWAEVQDVLPSRSEKITDGINIASRPCRVRIRYRNDITAAMRCQVDGRTLRIITTPVEIGRRDGLEFMAEELSTEGQEP